MTIFDTTPDLHDDHEHGDACGCGEHVDQPSPLARFLSSPFRVLVLAVAAILVVDAGGTDDGPGLCVFRRCTGGYCPGCGLTRSAKHLTRGEFAAAWQDHPWLVLVAPQVLVAVAAVAVVRRLGAVVDRHRVFLVVGGLNVVLLVGIWITRLVDGSIPRFF